MCFINYYQYLNYKIIKLNIFSNYIIKKDDLFNKININNAINFLRDY